MTDPRWADATVERVADMLRSYDDEHDGWFWEDLAIVALAALADAGLLLEPGSETRQEWSSEPSLTPRYVTGPIESDREIVCPMRAPEQAMRDYLRGMRGRPALVRRTVYTGPWREVSS